VEQQPLARTRESISASRDAAALSSSELQHKSGAPADGLSPLLLAILAVLLLGARYLLWRADEAHADSLSSHNAPNSAAVHASVNGSVIGAVNGSGSASLDASLDAVDAISTRESDSVAATAAPLGYTLEVALVAWLSGFVAGCRPLLRRGAV
jgi:hypothetical protein